eukprot:Gb_11600 [translate_table: standard]
MQGKGRVTLQFGCCYNYRSDEYGNRIGISQIDKVDPISNLFIKVIKRLIRWHVLPMDCVPDSCIINIYEVGYCIPPHIDHHDFLRSFCTVSLLNESSIVLSRELRTISPGVFDGPVHIPLLVGSVLVFKGNGADVAKHAISAVPKKRVSITFQRMEPTKRPNHYNAINLDGIEPLRCLTAHFSNSCNTNHT